MKTYNEIDIKYYDNDGNIQVRCSAPVTQDALVHYELMQSHYCKLSFKLSKPIYFLLGDFIDTPYGRFELIDLTKTKDNDTIGYSYEIQFDAYYRKFKNKILKYRPNTGSQEATFSLTSKISTHVEVIMKSLAYYAKLDKSYLYDPKFEGEGTDYTYVIDASVDANAAKLITYSNTSVLDAIANIAQTFECEWWFEGNILHFGTCENTNAITDFRLNDNIVSMSSSQSQSTYANRVYAFGAARNLPSGYKNDADADITKDGVVEKRLMLPTSAECSDKNKQLLAENGFELKNGYIQVGGLHEDQYVEGVTTNDDIYPRNLIKTSNVTSYEKDVEDESTPEEGDYIKRTFYRVNSLTIVNDDGEKTGDMAFRKAYILSGKNLHIVFQSGSLNGMDFECEFNPDGVSEILKDDDGNPILKDGKEQINPKSQVFEIVANEDYGRFLPDITLHPKDGDTFVLYNWDSTKLGETLVSAASNELLTDSIKNLKKSIIDPTTYTCTAEANYSFNQGRGNLHGVGDRVNLYNKGYDDSYRSSRVIGYEFSLDIPFDGAKYYVGEKPSYSRLNAMESKIEELVYNGQSYLNGNSGSGRSIYIIKSYDSITPTDYNVFSAKAVDEQRLNKTKDDTAKGTITWEKVQKFFSGLHVGNSNNENGGSWTPDAEGRSHLITDYLEVRMKAIFEELVINKTSTIGGKEIISPAGGVVAHKVEEVTVTYNNVSQKAYRCYFLAEQEGDAVDNDFAVGDQVRSESFNVRKDTYHKAGNHFYWRLVIGRDEDPVELEGKKYHYIDLSDTDCATASDVPAKGDVLNQCGNRTDVERQNCLIFSAVDTYSPSISLYHGINSYSFANREYVEYGVNKQNNKAFFNVYGDMYVGDRPTKENGYEGSSYIRYDSSTKQLSVKGKISAKSTVDGKELSQYFNKIAELQNQVDGAIETWFYDGVPTLENAPAISWKTDDDKKIHLGDLYYNNKTGKAYRFAKDGNTYKWTIITDTDIAKALSDARMAQETANGKMKVFSVQPTTPYQVGDIWVNATYPSDGSTYKNEVLRCQTNKAAGSQFAIGDWIKASKYTDDTVANAAKKAAEDAQKAAQTAQTDIKNLGKTVTDNKKEFDNYVTDGYLEPSEIAAMAQDSKRLEDDFAAAQKSYNEVENAEVLKDTKELTDLTSAFTDLSDAKKELIKDLSDISKRYNETDTNGKAAIVSAVGTKFTNFQSAYSTFYDKLGLANAYITSKIYGDLKQNITDLAGYKYLKDALGQTTDIDGGLVMTTLLALRDGDGNVQSGINGAIDPNRGKKSIATWWGGQMVDKDYNSGNLTPATSLIRFDGSGYLANGAIWWDVSGKVHADPTSFIISEKNLGAYLIFFEPTWKEGSTGTSVADLVSLKPNAPFSKLGVSGDATFEGTISFHGIKLTYDSTNKAIKIDGNLYATGGITAYGAGASTTGGGGGLNGSVKSYSNALKLTSESLSEIASAYSIKALDSRISSLEGGSAMDVSVSGSGNAVTAISKSGTTIIVTKGTTFLTSHQSLASYLTRTDAASLYQPKGNYLTSHQSLTNYYTKNEVNNIANGKSDVGHTHQYITDGSMTTITGWNNEVNFGGSNDSSIIYFSYRAQGNKPIISNFIFGSSTGTATVQAAGFKINGGTNSQFLKADGSTDSNTYLTSHQSLSNYYTKSETDSKLNGYLPLSGGTMQANARITHGNGNLYIGNTNNRNWLAVQDICSQSSIGDGNWSLRTDGTAHFQSIKFPYNRWISQVENGSNSPLKGIKLPNLQSNAIGIFSRVGNGADEGGIVLSEDTCVIYNSFDTGWGLSVRDKDLTQTDISSDDTVAFGIRDTYKLYSRGGFEKKDSSDDYVLLGGGGHSKITDLSVSNADTVDGYHATSGDNKPWGTIPVITSNGWMDIGRQLEFHFDNTTGSDYSTILRCSGNYSNVIDMPSASGTLALTSDNVASATKLAAARTIWGQSFDGTGNVDGTLTITNSGSGDPHIISTVNKWFHIVSKYKLVLYAGDYNSSQLDAINILSNHNVGIGVDPSYKLHVKGDIYSSATIRTAAQNQAIMLTNDANPAWISALDGQIIFNTGKAIRFGETAWNWNEWAGLKYTHSNKTIYLGIADNSVFNANSAQSNGTLRLAGITTITPDSGARIGGSGGNLYLGNANNSGWVCTQDICSQTNYSLWSIRQDGNAYFKNIYSGAATINGNLSVDGLISNKGILPANYEFNNKGTSCYVSADALCSGITAITDSIQVNQVTVQYSNDSGNSWTNYSMNNDAKFNLYASNAGLTQVYLGYNVITGNNDAEKLAQVKKNELIVSFYISNSCYAQPYFASVDISNGIDTICTVEILNNSGAVVETYTKHMTGWNQVNYISLLHDGNAGYGVGNNDRRYIRFKFKHDQKTTALRNTVINKIRIFSFTKYSFPTDRFMGHTGHIYNFDYNMNTYFPNSILAKGGVTAYQSSDIRLKQDLRKLDYLGIIKAMGGTFGFAWKKDNTRSIGWIAQHVLCNPHLKDIVETDEKGYYKINYWSPKLIATAFGAIEQVGDEVSRLKARVVFLESEVQRLSGDKKDCNKKRLDNKNINSLN